MPQGNFESRDWGLLVLRLAAGLMMLFLHGWGKMKGWYGMVTGEEWGFVDNVAAIGFPLPKFFASLAMLAESLGALLVAAGLFTRYAAFVLGGNMLVAVYMHLTMDPQRRFELAALYLAVMVLLLLAGPGRASLDQMIRNRK